MPDPSRPPRAGAGPARPLCRPLSRRAALKGLSSGSLLVLAGGGLAGCGDDRGDLPPLGTVGKAALLAPLSGARGGGLGASIAAAAALSGATVAVAGAPGAEVEVIDAGDTPETAAAAAARAIAGGARMLLGPLFADQARAVAAVAGDRPVVALSNDDTIVAGDPGGTLHVFGITPLHAAQAVLGLAAARGLGRVQAVVPPGPFGERHAAAVAEVAQRLGLVAATAVVEGADLAALAAGADAVYLPVVGGAFEAQAAAVAATGTQLLGSDQWSSIRPEAIPALRGSWFAAPDPLNLQGFLLAFDAGAPEAAGAAGVVAALAFDACELARTLGRIGAQDREGLRREAGFEGVLGPYRFLPSGRCERRLAVLAVADGLTTQIAAA